MRSQKNLVGKIYPRYQPYPLSLDSEDEPYPTKNRNDPEHVEHNRENSGVPEDVHDPLGEPFPSDWFAAEPTSSNDESSFRPLRLLDSLFSDRMGFLQRALEELKAARNEREQIMRHDLVELDSEISQCDRSITTLKAAFNNTEQQRHIERKLLELKRDRRRETLLSWRDLIWLRAEIRKLQREIETLGKTTASAGNRDAPTGSP
jgi:hypothetical protein